MPTPAGWWVMALGLASIAVGRLLGWLELYPLGVALVVVVALSMLVVQVRRPTLSVTRTVSPPRVHAGDSARVDLQVANLGRNKTPLVTLEDPVAGTKGAAVRLAPLAGREVRSAAYRLPTTRRGLLRIGPLTVTRTDPLGLARRSSQESAVEEITVYPRVVTIDPPSSGRRDPRAALALERQRSPRRDEFAGLREYHPGDDLRSVHWRSSARTGELVVRQHEEPLPLLAAVLLDTRRAAYPSDAAFERAVSAAASIVSSAHYSGERVMLAALDGTVLEIEPRSEGLSVALDYLAGAGVTTSGSLRGALGQLRADAAGAAAVLVTGRTTGPEIAGAFSGRRPSTAYLVVCEPPFPAGSPPGIRLVDGTDEEQFVASWSALRQPTRRGGVA